MPITKCMKPEAAKESSVMDSVQTSETTSFRSQASLSVSSTTVGLTEIMSNIIGTAGFVVGSALFIVNQSFVGSLIFAASCIFCGISCSIYAHKARLVNNFVPAFGFAEQALGCFIFTVSSCFFVVPKLVLWGSIGFMVASLNFMDGTLIQHVVAQSIFRPYHPLWPSTPVIFPSMLGNTIGSLLFCLGSVCFFFDSLYLPGSWFYTIGSAIFFLASWSEACVWYEDYITIKRKPVYNF